jgi:hypothetical protein
MPEPETEDQGRSVNEQDGRFDRWLMTLSLTEKIIVIVGGIVAMAIAIFGLLRDPTNVPQITPSPTVPAVEIHYIEYDPEETPDHDHEYVLLSNTWEEPQDMTHWSLQDEQNPPYEFPEFVLRPGAVARVWAGKGTDTETDLYQGRNTSIWNNDSGDTATLKNGRGEIIDTFSYEP